ncbi:MAG: class I SAM-dependent methyltransferase, partial [Micropepsaceae bacterium]
GVTSAHILLAMERNSRGRLISIDLPALSDPHGQSIGLAVPDRLRARWQLHSGSTRQHLPRILNGTAPICFFVSDSANIFTMQRYEFETAWPHIRRGGGALFNNISAKFQQYLSGTEGVVVHCIRQVEKSKSVSALVLK